MLRFPLSIPEVPPAAAAPCVSSPTPAPVAFEPGEVEGVDFACALVGGPLCAATEAEDQQQDAQNTQSATTKSYSIGILYNRSLIEYPIQYIIANAQIGLFRLDSQYYMPKQFDVMLNKYHSPRGHTKLEVYIYIYIHKLYTYM